MDSFVLLCRFRTIHYTLYVTLLLPNGIKLFETDSLLNIGIHRYTNEECLCVFSTFKENLQGTEAHRVTGSQLLISFQKSHKALETP